MSASSIDHFTESVSGGPFRPSLAAVPPSNSAHQPTSTPSLTHAADVLQLLSRTTYQVLGGDLDPARGRVVIGLANLLLKAIPLARAEAEKGMFTGGSAAYPQQAPAQPGEQGQAGQAEIHSRSACSESSESIENKVVGPQPTSPESISRDKQRLADFGTKTSREEMAVDGARTGLVETGIHSSQSSNPERSDQLHRGQAGQAEMGAAESPSKRGDLIENTGLASPDSLQGLAVSNKQRLAAEEAARVRVIALLAELKASVRERERAERKQKRKDRNASAKDRTWSQA